MYSITNTKGVVLKTYDQGEKDLLLSIFTKELGHIYAKVSGAKDLNSKHRYSIQEYSLANFSLVKGKAGWRITNTSFIKSYYFESFDKTKRETILKILLLVKRFYLGEESSYKIFEDLLSGFENILEADSVRSLENIEAITVANFLYDLGYLPQKPDLSYSNIYNIRKDINLGIKNSGL